MTSPESPSPSHPARGAGFALLGVAVVALVIGVISLFGGGEDPLPPSADSTGQQTATTTPGSTEPGASSVSPTTASSPTIPTITTEPPPTTQPPAPPVGEPQAAKPPVRVYNNSTIGGLAARASDDVKKSGWSVVDTGNYSQGQIPTTTVYYRPGTDEEASAKELATVLRARVEARFDGIQSAHAGIIVIVTNDYQGSSTGKK